MENYTFNTYRNTKKGEIIIEAKSESSALNKIKSMNNYDLKDVVDNEVETDDSNISDAQLLVFYHGNLVRKI